MQHSKDRILEEIRRLGDERGGRLSIDEFTQESGISQHQILGKFWATWNAAIIEAGLAPQKWGNVPADEGAAIDAFARFIERLGHWPTHVEIKLERNGNRAFPSLRVVTRLLRTGDLEQRLVEYCATHEDLERARAIATSRLNSRREDRRSEPRVVSGYVYMMRSGRRFKIGRTSSPARRHREVKLDLPDPTVLVHAIETDDPTGIEAYWHRRFAESRVRDTEFFELRASDVAAFRRRKYQYTRYLNATYCI